jgi:hypothetical protein
MSDRPTPETDALITLRSGFGVTDYEWRQHSRKLECQRDELQRAVQNHQGAINIAIKSLDKTITQRDQARELAQELRDALEAVMPYIVGDRIVSWKAAETALTKAKEVLP